MTETKAEAPQGRMAQLDYLATQGVTGLTTYGGTIKTSELSQLDGLRGIKIYTEMQRNHPVIGAFFLLLDTLAKQTTWNIEAGGEDADDLDKANFVSECLDDMSGTTFRDFLSEAMSMAAYGWSAHEICFKLRKGLDDSNPARSSRFDDNKIGLSGLPIRAQDTLVDFVFATDPASGRVDTDHIVGMRQWLPNGGTTVIARSKLAMFRTQSYKNNPLGKSMLRHAYMSYSRGEKIRDYEALAIQRDTVGLPMLRVPSDMLQQNSTAQQKQSVSRLQDMMGKLYQAAIKFITLPSDKDDKGNYEIDLELLGSPGQRQFDMRATAREYDMDIARALLADVLYLGSDGVGSYALSSSKVTLLATMIAGLLDNVCETFNRDVVPLLLRLNSYSLDRTPKLVRGDVELPDLAELANAIASLVGAGALTPDDNIENKLRVLFSFPPKEASANAEVGTGQGEQDESTDDPTAPPEGAKSRRLIRVNV